MGEAVCSCLARDLDDKSWAVGHQRKGGSTESRKQLARAQGEGAKWQRGRTDADGRVAASQSGDPLLFSYHHLSHR